MVTLPRRLNQPVKKKMEKRRHRLISHARCGRLVVGASPCKVNGSIGIVLESRIGTGLQKKTFTYVYTFTQNRFLNKCLRVRHLLPVSLMESCDTSNNNTYKNSIRHHHFFEGVTPGKASITDESDETLSSSLLDFSSKLRRFSDSAVQSDQYRSQNVSSYDGICTIGADFTHSPDSSITSKNCSTTLINTRRNSYAFTRRLSPGIKTANSAQRNREIQHPASYSKLTTVNYEKIAGEFWQHCLRLVPPSWHPSVDDSIMLSSAQAACFLGILLQEIGDTKHINFLMGKRRRASSSDSSVSDSPPRHKRRGGKKKLKKRVKRLEAILARLATHSTTESDRGNPRKSPTSVDIDHKNQSGKDSEIDLTFEDNLSDSGSSAHSQNRQADQPVVSQGNNSPHKNDSVPHEVTSHGNTHSLPSVSHEPYSHKGAVDPANQPTDTLPPDIAEILGENEPHPVNTDRSLHPLIQPTTSSCPTPYPGGRQVIWEAFRRRNAPEEAIGTMIDSLSESTVSQYSSSLALWWDYCSKNNISPWSFEVKVILKFFQHVLDTRPNAYSSFNTLRSALSLISPDGIGNNVLVRRYIKGISKLRPPKPRYLNTWDPEIVLKYLEENDALGLAPLSKKLVVLLLLATGHRLQTISLIETNNVTFSDQGAKILIPSRVKTSNPNRPQPSFFLPVFSARPKLCVSTVLRTYLEATAHDAKESNIRAYCVERKTFNCNYVNSYAYCNHTNGCVSSLRGRDLNFPAFIQQILHPGDRGKPLIIITSLNRSE
ncbi:unnamed protein product [Nesidiocoris tenuis]|uniref:Tyr recombinase domain-containing protein n=1 Tax=Nesidiocoris tenuis TaxID=355587 RepID=A0A6H5HKI9_9HEMI|nr:unnamed protein product [Nesidiocoris tenuis]